MISFRQWRYEDILKIAEMERVIFKDRWTYNMLAESFLSKNFYGILAEENGGVIAYGGFINVLGSGDITRIAVKESYRKQNIGSKILQMILECASEHLTDTLTLEVRVSNENAIKLYTKFGFEKIDIRKNYYKDEDAFVMQLKLVR